MARVLCVLAFLCFAVCVVQNTEIMVESEDLPAGQGLLSSFDRISDFQVRFYVLWVFLLPSCFCHSIVTVRVFYNG